VDAEVKCPRWLETAAWGAAAEARGPPVAGTAAARAALAAALGAWRRGGPEPGRGLSLSEADRARLSGALDAAAAAAGFGVEAMLEGLAGEGVPGAAPVVPAAAAPAPLLNSPVGPRRPERMMVVIARRVPSSQVYASEREAFVAAARGAVRASAAVGAIVVDEAFDDGESSGDEWGKPSSNVKKRTLYDSDDSQDSGEDEDEGLGIAELKAKCRAVRGSLDARGEMVFPRRASRDSPSLSCRPTRCR